MLNSPRHSVAYAQNFLHSPRLVDHLLDRSSIGPDDRVLEIGPGKGIITAALARRCREVLAVEKDPDLAHLLRARFALSPAVTIREEDFLGTRLPLPPYKVFANVPFNCTAEIIRRLTETRHPPDDIYLAVQQEAAERFLGRPRESLRSVLLKPWFEPSLAYRFRQADFVPAPQVEVVMLRLRKRGPPLIQASRAQLYRDLVISPIHGLETIAMCSSHRHTQPSTDRYPRPTPGPGPRSPTHGAALRAMARPLRLHRRCRPPARQTVRPRQRGTPERAAGAAVQGAPHPAA